MERARFYSTIGSYIRFATRNANPLTFCTRKRDFVAHWARNHLARLGLTARVAPVLGGLDPRRRGPSRWRWVGISRSRSCGHKASGGGQLDTCAIAPTGLVWLALSLMDASTLPQTICIHINLARPTVFWHQWQAECGGGPRPQLNVAERFLNDSLDACRISVGGRALNAGRHQRAPWRDSP